MKFRSTLLTALVFSSGFVACGGDDGGGGGTIDAAAIDATALDAGTDAPPGLTGLGQTCVLAMAGADCPTTAPECVGLQGGTATYCTPLCLMGGSATTNAQGQITTTTPAPSATACSAAYSGTIGTPACGVILAYVPMDATLQPNKAYTGIDLGCVIRCSTTGTCPTGFAASGAAGAMCVCR